MVWAGTQAIHCCSEGRVLGVMHSTVQLHPAGNTTTRCCSELGAEVLHGSVVDVIHLHDK